MDHPADVGARFETTAASAGDYQSWMAYSAVAQAVAAVLALGAIVFQVAILRRQTDISERQQRLMREQHVAAHRPRLRVRNFVLDEGHVFRNGETLRGQFYVSNVGGGSATIRESHCELLWNVDGLPMRRPYEGKDGNDRILAGRVLEGSLGHAAIFYSIEDEYGVWPFETAPGGDLRAFLLGWVDYADENGLVRRTAFCREFLQGNGSARFCPVADPDHEYEE